MTRTPTGRIPDRFAAAAGSVPAMDVHLYFDATCPWTWLTSRWLVDVAARRDLEVGWRTCSLAVLNEGKPFPPELLAAVPDLPARQALGVRVLRLVEALGAAGRNDDIGRLYTEVGQRLHVEGRPPDPGLLAEAATAAGVADLVAAADDGAWDTPVRASTEDAVARAGPDVGSPVLLLEGHDRGSFGPIVSPPPVGEDALRLWEAVVTLHSLPTFLEVKRGRTAGPALG